MDTSSKYSNYIFSHASTQVAPAECEVEEFLINIVGSDGRSGVTRRTGILGETRYGELISWEQLPDTRGSYTFSVQALGLDGNSTRTSSAKVGKCVLNDTHVIYMLRLASCRYSTHIQDQNHIDCNFSSVFVSSISQ